MFSVSLKCVRTLICRMSSIKTEQCNKITAQTTAVKYIHTTNEWNKLTLSWPASMLILISAILSNVALQKPYCSLHRSTTKMVVIQWVVQFNLPDAVVMIRELFVIKSKLIHKVSSHLLNLVVWKCLGNTSKDDFIFQSLLFMLII